MPRFFLPQSFDAPMVRLAGDEARHLSRVLRLKAGDEVILFDGRGGEAQARISTIAADGVELSVLERSTGVEPARLRLTLATAVPKGERFDWLVEKATELGVDRLVPIITTRSVVHPGPGKLDRLRRTIVAASKQCGRSRLMELTEPIAWQELVEREFKGDRVALVADPSGEKPPWDARSGPLETIVVIGPEGGLTPNELESAVAAGARLISLGPRILRIETAALAAAALATCR